MVSRASSKRSVKDNLYEDDEFNMSLPTKWTGKVEWRRPKDIHSNPKLFVGKTERFDAKQGVIGDCYAVAAIDRLSERKDYLERVVPPDQGFDDPSYNGTFHFNFHRKGKWIEVTIDDRLPTYDGKLIFARSSDENEFWPALLEKAYAKFCGSYDILSKGGLPSKAIEDFTGETCDNLYADKISSDQLWTRLRKSYEEGSLLFAGRSDRPSEESKKIGLPSKHAYAITMVDEVKTKGQTTQKLIRMRNPWGNSTEWKGRWSDKSNEWLNVTEKERARLNFRKAEDGEFWITIEDFQKNFSLAQLCDINHDLCKGQHCESNRNFTENIQVSVSGPRNKRVVLNVSPMETVDHLIQEAARKCGLGGEADVQLTCGVESLQRGTATSIKETTIRNGSKLELTTRCLGG